uniref:Uncharacterized protein MANES_15G001200 n=1 Tax=Rhizophora mucronata TaxID=61149 RepID=A0A2P2JIV1_RHIMU
MSKGRRRETRREKVGGRERINREAERKTEASLH